jgi:outer membrane protein
MNDKGSPMMSKHKMAAAVLAALSALTLQVQAQGLENPWQVRLRAVHLDMSNKDNTGLGLTVNNRTMPEIDVSYFFTPNMAAELILTTPQKQTVYSNGAAIGTFRHLPPTLLLQYHFTGLPGYRPYVGAGINYTDISKVNLLSGAASLDNHSWGGALQLGVDFELDRNWSINLDLKKVYLRTDVYVGGNNVGTLRLNPVMAGLGVGYRF